ncbi:hypothetical protein JL720_6208 [Aureococcus anophagefferens]|nr:hypothetical protein JL720_6208 [Aureococcus anophagefferens]
MVKEDLGPSNVQPLRELRYALKYHEDLGSNVAAGATLLKMGRAPRAAPPRPPGRAAPRARAQAAVNVKSMAPRELVEFSKTQCLLAVVFARQKVPSKAEEHFDKSLKLFGRLKLSQRNATHIKEREALLASAVGGDDPRLVETRRVRILWAHELGAGAGPAGETAVNS